MAHTPEPWKQDSEYFAIRDGRDNLIAHYARQQDGSHNANANLIAAAPELLRVLQTIAAYPVTIELPEPIAAAARAAIAKAIGNAAG